MNCGEEIKVKDVFGSYEIRVIAQCHDRFLVITHIGDHRNGWMLSSWREVLRELVAVTVPAKLVTAARNAESMTGGMYHSLPLTYPLSVRGLAGLLGVEPKEVDAVLADLAVQVDV